MNAPGELLEELTQAHRFRWTHTDELLALILERLDNLATLTHIVNMKPEDRPRRIPAPYRYPRPATPRRRPSSLDEIRRFFGK